MRNAKAFMLILQLRRDHESPVKDLQPTDVLCHAIILQAVKDFRLAYRSLRRRPDNRQASETVKEITRFFCSDYFTLLTELDGPRLLRRLIEEERSVAHECA